MAKNELHNTKHKEIKDKAEERGFYIPLPSPVLFLLEKLENASFEAYLVGGAVRDSLLGLEAHDYDLTTSATTDEIRQVFADFPLVLAGEKHGTVGVILEKTLYEITTFRTESEYEDHRRPSKVTFTTSLEEDLKRRDFTINAFAYNPSSGVLDFFDGRSDLQKKIIRTVGDPHLRFQEDALRIMRAFRFAASYGFTLEEETFLAARSHFSDLSYLAQERVTSELKRLVEAEFLTKEWQKQSCLLKNLFPAFPLQGKENIDFLPRDFALRFAYLASGSEFSQEEKEENIAALKLDKVSAKRILYLWESTEEIPALDLPKSKEKNANIKEDNTNTKEEDTNTNALLLLQFQMEKQVELDSYFLLQDCILSRNNSSNGSLESQSTGTNKKETLAYAKALWQRIKEQQVPQNPEELAVRGKDILANSHLRRRAIGMCLDLLWQMTIKNAWPNEKEYLLAKLPEVANALKTSL